jgi:hypothetical protein
MKMEKYLLVVESNCTDPEREEEFNDWYNNVHIPDVLEAEGHIKAERFELINPVEGKGKYLAIYEIESDDFDETWAKATVKIKEKIARGRMSSLMKATTRGVYKKIGSFSKKEIHKI